MTRATGLYHDRRIVRGRACGLLLAAALALGITLVAPALHAAENAGTKPSAAVLAPPKPPQRPATLTTTASNGAVATVEIAAAPLPEPVPSPDQLSAIAPAAAPDPALPPAAPAPKVNGEAMRISFGSGDAALPESAKQPLIELAARLAGVPKFRLEIRAFAEGTAETASQSRRLSLSRALAVRQILIEAGVRSTRIDVRALGNQTQASPADHADVRVVDRGG